MRPDVATFVKSCHMCQEVNPSEQRVPYGKIPVSGLFLTWSIDFTGRLPTRAMKNKYLLVEVEHLSSWSVACAFPESKFHSAGVIEFVENEIESKFSCPEFIVSDKIMTFNSAAIRAYVTKMNIKWKYVSTYNPRGNSKLERMIGTLNTALKKVMNER